MCVKVLKCLYGHFGKSIRSRRQLDNKLEGTCKRYPHVSYLLSELFVLPLLCSGTWIVHRRPTHLTSNFFLLFQFFSTNNDVFVLPKWTCSKFSRISNRKDTILKKRALTSRWVIVFDCKPDVLGCGLSRLQSFRSACVPRSFLMPTSPSPTIHEPSSAVYFSEYCSFPYSLCFFFPFSATSPTFCHISHTFLPPLECVQKHEDESRNNEKCMPFSKYNYQDRAQS